MPKTMREQLEESFEDAKEKAGGPDEDTEESLGSSESEEEESESEAVGGEDSDLDDDAGESEEPGEDEGDKPVSDEEDESGDEDVPEETDPPKEDLKPPVSWKPAIREKWKNLPPEVKAEVHRREADIQKGLQQASGYRKVAEEYLNTVKPFQSLMQSMGASPSQAIQTVMGTVAQLSQGTNTQKAQIIAQVIKDYGVSVEVLDQVLSGQQVSDEPEDAILSKFEEKLRPIYGFMEQLQGADQAQTGAIQTKAMDDLNSFVSDPTNDFIEDVRETMADYLEVAGRNQRVMTLKEAYDRACQDNPEIRKIIQQREAAKRVATPTGDELARKKKAASSLRGNPTGGGSAGEKDLRSVIASQFDDA